MDSNLHWCPVMNRNPEVVFVASEMYPFSKSGGLADVMGILPLTLHRMGVPVAVVTPLYGRLSSAHYQLRLVAENCPVGYPWPEITADIFQADYEGLPVFFVDRGEYFDRRHYYCTYKGDYFDNCERFLFFCRAALAGMKRLFPSAPRVVHVHDWHAALTTAYLHHLRGMDPYWSETGTVMTIHNLAFQGRFSSRLFWDCGLPDGYWNMDGVEFYDSFNLLKGGIAYADRVTTVSPTYADEILTPEFGCGLEGILGRRADVLSGILNGADYDIWDPSADRFLECEYSSDRLDGKKTCKKKLLHEMGLSPSLLDRPLLGFIGRLRKQKGIDLLLDILPELLRRDIGVVVLGEGNLTYEANLQDVIESYPGQVAGHVGYTEELSHQIQAASDIFLMPSRYEPCGLTQMYSLRYGTPPVATAVGGLVDTIIPWPDPEATGFIFDRSTSESFLGGIVQALEVWENRPAWRALQLRAMQTSFSWEDAAARYMEVYGTLGFEL